MHAERSYLISLQFIGSWRFSIRCPLQIAATDRKRGVNSGHPQVQASSTKQRAPQAEKGSSESRQNEPLQWLLEQKVEALTAEAF